ncbi:MAG: hypothetical protein KKB70_06210 [Proteobacteria bacterium]|nr:hypothetical protein [Pseudomonadota bacterium]
MGKNTVHIAPNAFELIHVKCFGTPLVESYPVKKDERVVAYTRACELLASVKFDFENRELDIAPGRPQLFVVEGERYESGFYGIEELYVGKASVFVVRDRFSPNKFMITCMPEWEVRMFWENTSRFLRWRWIVYLESDETEQNAREQTEAVQHEQASGWEGHVAHEIGKLLPQPLHQNTA